MQLQNWTRKNKVGDKVNGYFKPSDKPAADFAQRIHFLHGTGFSSLCNAKLAESLPNSWDMWFSDAPGHGLSDQPSIEKMPNWLRMADTMADVIYEVADIKNKGKVIGVGHSMGGVLTLLAASRHPENFSRIILFDPVLFTQPLVMAQHLARVTGIWTVLPTARAVNKRRSEWPDKKTMRASLEAKPLYKNWHSEALDYFVQSGTKPLANEGIELGCDPRWESSMFGSYPRELWNHIENLNICTDIIIPKNTLFFIPSALKKAQSINKNIHVHNYGDTHKLLNHCFPMEQPEETAGIVHKLINTASEL